MPCFVAFILSVLGGLKLSIFLGDSNNPIALMHDDIIKWKHFPRYWPICGLTSQWPMTQSFDILLDLYLKKNNGWANNWDTGDLRRHCAHYDITVIIDGYFNGIGATTCLPLSNCPNARNVIYYLCSRSMPRHTKTQESTNQLNYFGVNCTCNKLSSLIYKDV